MVFLMETGAHQPFGKTPLKYTPEKKKTPIQLIAWVEGSKLGIRVADQGPGPSLGGPESSLREILQGYPKGKKKKKKGAPGWD